VLRYRKGLRGLRGFRSSKGSMSSIGSKGWEHSIYKLLCFLKNFVHLRLRVKKKGLKRFAGLIV
jgi:hypothetical protein